MEMNQLEFFRKVVEEGSFSKAAERVYRTQPAVSIAIRRLEEEIGAPLFERSQKTPALTDVGQLVYDYAKRILSLRDQALDGVAELKSLKRGRVRIGANESTSHYLLPQIILDYRKRYPQVKVEIFGHSSDHLSREVLDGKVDFALMAFDPVDSDLESFPVLKDELVLIMHPNHPLAKRAAVTVEELGKESFVAHNVKTGSRQRRFSNSCVNKRKSKLTTSESLTAEDAEVWAEERREQFLRDLCGNLRDLCGQISDRNWS